MSRKLPPQPVTPEIKKLVLACNGLIDVVNRYKYRGWMIDAPRLEFSPEWRKFYVAWCKLNRP